MFPKSDGEVDLRMLVVFNGTFTFMFMPEWLLVLCRSVTVFWKVFRLRILEPVATLVS